jgi:hypothetical protein
MKTRVTVKHLQLKRLGQNNSDDDKINFCLLSYFQTKKVQARKKTMDVLYCLSHHLNLKSFVFEQIYFITIVQ